MRTLEPFFVKTIFLAFVAANLITAISGFCLAVAYIFTFFLACHALFNRKWLLMWSCIIFLIWIFI